MEEDVRIFYKVVLQYNQIHQNVADSRHGIFRVDHFKLGIIYQVERFGHIRIIFSLSLEILH